MRLKADTTLAKYDAIAAPWASLGQITPGCVASRHGLQTVADPVHALFKEFLQLALGRCYGAAAAATKNI